MTKANTPDAEAALNELTFRQRLLIKRLRSALEGILPLAESANQLIRKRGSDRERCEAMRNTRDALRDTAGEYQ
jgi:hypothetical protein